MNEQKWRLCTCPTDQPSVHCAYWTHRVDAAQRRVRVREAHDARWLWEAGRHA